jgi:hypothetical protein
MSRSVRRRARWLAVGLCLLGRPAAAQAAHPLITEDTGTHGLGRFQLELTTEHTTTREAGTRQVSALTSAVVAYGVADTADVLVTVPWLRLGAPVAEAGLADIGLDLKWRFYESGPLSVAFKPGLTFPTGDDARSLGVGKHTWSAYLVTTWDLKPWTLHLHLGHLHHNNTFNARVDIWHASAAVVRQLGDSLKLALDAGVDTNTDRAADSDPVFVIAGLIWSLRPDFDLDLGVKTERTDTHRANTLLAGLAWRW